jgi:hypothetical protein
MIYYVLNAVAQYKEQISAPLLGLAHRKYYRIGKLMTGSYWSYFIL